MFTSIGALAGIGMGVGKAFDTGMIDFDHLIGGALACYMCVIYGRIFSKELNACAV